METLNSALNRSVFIGKLRAWIHEWLASQPNHIKLDVIKFIDWLLKRLNAPQLKRNSYSQYQTDYESRSEN
jgi:hypothetical protein